LKYIFFRTVILSVPIYSYKKTTGVFYWLENIELDVRNTPIKKSIDSIVDFYILDTSKQ